MSKKCAKCGKTVYPVEELKCLEKIWHKACFKCQVCNMTLSMKNYKGFDKLPYCGAHVPKAKATVVADTPENKRLAENSKTQSTVKYHAEFEANKGRFTQIADDPETLRIKAAAEVISNISYHDVKGQKQDQEKKRSLQGGGENTAVTPEPGFKTPDPPEDLQTTNTNHEYTKQPQYQPPPPSTQTAAAPRSSSASSYNSAHQPTSRSTPPNATPYQTGYNSNQVPPHMAGGRGGPPSSHQPPPYANPPQQPYHQPPQQYSQQQQQQLLLQQQQQQLQLKQQQQQMQLKQQEQMQYAQQQRQQQMYHQQQQQQSRQAAPNYGHGHKTSGGGHHPSSHHQKVPQQYSQYQQQPNGYGGHGYPQQHPGQHQQMADPRRVQNSHQQPASAFKTPVQAAPPPTRVPAGMRCYQAMYDYESQDADEVSFRDGDIIINAAFIDEGWMTGTVHRTGQSGMLPANYVEPVNL